MDLIDREPEELWKEVEAIVKDEAINNIPKARKPKNSKLLTNMAIDIADKRREAEKRKAHPDVFRKLNAEFQRQARKDKEERQNTCSRRSAKSPENNFKPRIAGLKSKSEK